MNWACNALLGDKEKRELLRLVPIGRFSLKTMRTGEKQERMNSICKSYIRLTKTNRSASVSVHIVNK